MLKLAIVALTAVVALIAGGGHHARQTASVAPGSGTLWVDGGSGTCARGSGPYDPASACKDLQSAYAAASCGDVVYIRAGTYPHQTIADPSGAHVSCTQPVRILSFQPLAAKVAGVTITAPWVNVRGIDAGTSSVGIFGWDGTGCHSVPAAHIAVTASVFGAIYIDNAQAVTIGGNSIGNITNGESEVHDGTDPQCPGNSGLVFRGNVWHDYYNTVGGAVHMECLQLENVQNTVVDRNRFENCGQYDIFVSNGWPAGPVQNLTVSNNYFAPPCSAQPRPACAALGSFAAAPTSSTQIFTGVHVVFNTFGGTYPLLGAMPGAVMTDDLVAYNITAGYPDSVHCGYGRWTLVKNMNSGRFSHCGGDFLGVPTFANPSPPAYNYNLLKGSRGIDAVKCPVNASPRDIDGHSRPTGKKARCDVGAFELTPTQPELSRR